VCDMKTNFSYMNEIAHKDKLDDTFDDNCSTCVFFQMKPDVEAYFLDVGDLLKKQQRQLIQVTEALVATDVVSLSSWHSTVQQYVTMFTFTSHSVQAGGVGLPVFRRTCSMLFV